MTEQGEMGSSTKNAAPNAETTVSMADLVQRLGAGVDRFDAAFSRGLAARLDADAARIELPVIEAMGCTDVVVTFSLARRVRLVVTGTAPGGLGEVTVSFDEADFSNLLVHVRPDDRDAPYAFCTLDYSWRGKRGELLVQAGPIPAGQVVTVRALATFGRRAELRVQGLGFDASVSMDAVRWLDDDASEP